MTQSIQSHSSAFGAGIPTKTQKFVGDFFAPFNGYRQCVSLLTKEKDTGLVHQRSIALRKFSELLDTEFSKKDLLEKDLWFTPNLFRSFSRTAENLSALTSIYVDLDIYVKESLWATRSPKSLPESIIALLDEENLPRPTWIVFSGKGLQIYWAFEAPIPAKALPRWSAVEDRVIELFKPYGADSKASDPSRVLRIPGSFSTKNGEECLVLREERDAEGKLQRYSFETLAEFFLPKARKDCKKKEGKGRLYLRATRKASCFYGAVYRDLLTIMKARGRIASGKRAYFLFHMLVAGCHARIITPENFWAKAKELAYQIDPAWASSIHEKSVAEILRRYELDLAGVETDHGKPNLYTPKRLTIIRETGVTAQEQIYARTLCLCFSASERKNRFRRQVPDRGRKEITQERMARIERACALRKDGLTVQEIADAMRITKGTVSKYLKASKKFPTCPLSVAKPRLSGLDGKKSSKGAESSCEKVDLMACDETGNGDEGAISVRTNKIIEELKEHFRCVPNGISSLQLKLRKKDSRQVGDVASLPGALRELYLKGGGTA